MKLPEKVKKQCKTIWNLGHYCKSGGNDNVGGVPLSDWHKVTQSDTKHPHFFFHSAPVPITLMLKIVNWSSESIGSVKYLFWEDANIVDPVNSRSLLKFKDI